MAIYGYARCSTSEDKQDIKIQTSILQNMGASIETIYFEYAPGYKKERREFTKLMSILKEGDTICATEVSRITRSTKDLCEIIDMCNEKKIKLIIKDSLVIDCANGIDPMTKAFLQICGVFAELERNIMSYRVKLGLENARKSGKTLGRKPFTVETIPKKFIEYYSKYRVRQFNLTELARISNLSRPTVSKYVKMLKESECEIE